MKHTFRYILSSVVMLLPALAFAQTELQDPPIYDEYNVKGGVGTKKSVSDPDTDGIYTVTLETFATGVTSIISKAIPSDIVLLLDYSSSMLTNDNITKMKKAVVDFVREMQSNNETLNLQPGQMGNRIAFVLYAGLLYDDYPETTEHVNGNRNLPLLNDYPYFNARFVNQFVEVTDLTAAEGGSSVIYNDINIISPSSQHAPHPAYLNGNNYGDTNKGTNTPAAMAKALELVEQNLAHYSPDARSTTVVLFTDGEPCNIYQQHYVGSGSSGFNASYANACLADAKTIKGEGVPIFSVGLFNYNGNDSQANRQTRTFVEYTSSNYPNIAPTQTNYWTNNNNLLHINDPMSGDYCSIVSDGLNLSSVFKTIAQASGGSESKIPGETQVVDVVSNSFEVPSDFKASDVVVYRRRVNKAGTGWGTAVNFVVDVVDPGSNPPMTVNYTPSEGHIGVALKDGKLTVVGFDYSKADDVNVTPYNGNWVGWRDENDCAGNELVIEFKVKADPDATGGDGTNTNMPNSGVYVPVYDDDGHIIDYTNVNSYEVPHKDLPINIVIEKSGLRAGESATIQIYRCHQKKVNGVVQYNEKTGKPLPEKDIPTVGQDPKDDCGWENFTKVILTNTTGIDGETVSKTLLSLHADYVYLLVEDNWGWAYILDDAIMSTDEVEKNPFEFTNTEKTDAVKHAEAVSINHFGENYVGDKRVETYKSSKTQYFSTPTNK